MKILSKIISIQKIPDPDHKNKEIEKAKGAVISEGSIMGN